MYKNIGIVLNFRKQTALKFHEFFYQPIWNLKNKYMYTAVLCLQFYLYFWLFLMVFHRNVHLILQKATNTVLIVLKFMTWGLSCKS